MTPTQRAAAPPAIPAEEIADAVTLMLTDENLAGRVMVCRHEQPRRTLLPVCEWADYLDSLPTERL